MYKACKTEESAERQRHIEGCFAKLLVNRQFNDITVSELCEKAEIPRKAFYRYFESKEDVLHAMADHSMEDYESYSGPYKKGTERSIILDIEKFFLFWGDRRELLSALGNSGIRMRFVEYIYRRCASEKLGARFVTQSQSEAAVQLTTIFSVYGIFAVVFRWHAMDCKPSAHEMACLTDKMLTEPLFTWPEGLR